MHILSTAFVAVSVIGFASAGPGCGAEIGITEPKTASAVSHFQYSPLQDCSSMLNKGTGPPVQITVHWNIFYDANNPSDGNYNNQVIYNTLAYVNRIISRDFNLTLFVPFANIRRLGISKANLHGVAPGNYVETVIKGIRAGGPETLNIYTVGVNPNLPYAAWSTFPYLYNKSHPIPDGIVMPYDFLPGTNNNLFGFNSGSLLVHELGHWLGLFHTFHGESCTGLGDYVPDTPAEAYSNNYAGCSVPRDSCSDQQGSDPIHNYMDYSLDYCYTDPFTPCQRLRVKTQLATYRFIFT